MLDAEILVTSEAHRGEPHRGEPHRAAWKTKAGGDWTQTHHHCLYYCKELSDAFNGINGSNLLPIVAELSHCLIVNAQSSFVVQASN